VKALVITGGEGPAVPLLRRLAETADIILAADSGFDLSRHADIEPDLLVGDFDSLADKASLLLYEKDHILQYPVDKDATDTELALDAAWGRGADHVVLAGGGGGRLDHLIGLICLFVRKRSPDEWHTAAESIYRLKSGEIGIFHPGIGATVSMFALFEKNEAMSSQGLKWPLKGLSWKPGEFGVSNVATAEEVEIQAGSADILVVLPSGTQRLS
jgi:thiamine pyrophosphokinase